VIWKFVRSRGKCFYYGGDRRGRRVGVHAICWRHRPMIGEITVLRIEESGANANARLADATKPRRPLLMIQNKEGSHY